jgi:hypothetical protein
MRPFVQFAPTVSSKRYVIFDPVLSDRKKCESQHNQPSHDNQGRQGAGGYPNFLFGRIVAHFNLSVATSLLSCGLRLVQYPGGLSRS